jgi:hypothetical protein
MRFFSSLLLLCLTLVLSLSKGLGLAYYCLNKTYIQTELCEQKDLPRTANKCNGKCHLRKILSDSPTAHLGEAKKPAPASENYLNLVNLFETLEELIGLGLDWGRPTCCQHFQALQWSKKIPIGIYQPRDKAAPLRAGALSSILDPPKV